MTWPQFQKFLDPVVFENAILSCGSLVYISNLKCASSFFHESFRRLKWHKITFGQINWKNQHIFAHILDPDTRRNKAVAEVIHQNQAQDLFYNDESFRKLIRHIPLLDGHSKSFHDLYGDHCDEIDWIPITGRGSQEVADKTSAFLEEIGNIKLFNRWAWDRSHMSDSYKKQLEQDIAKLWETDRPASSDQYLQRDRDLHHRVITQFNYNAPTWAESSWLRR